MNALDERLGALKVKYWPDTLYKQILLVALSLVLLVVIVIPIGTMAFYSLLQNYPVTEGYGLTLVHYTDLFADVDLLGQLSWDTFVFSAGTTLVAMVVGVTLAFLLAKYFESSLLHIFILLPYGLPGIAALTGWIILLGDNGIVTNSIVRILGLESAPYTIYSMGGMIWVEGLHTAPVAFLLTYPAIRTLPAAMEEASFATGASRLHTVRKIIIPLIWPSIISTTIFLFARGMAVVSTPAVLGLPANIFTYGSAIPFLFLAGRSLSYSRALAFSVLLTVLSAVLILYYMRVQSGEGRFATITGGAGQRSQQYQTTWLRRRLYYAFIFGYVVLAGILPLVAVFWQSVSPDLQLTMNAAEVTVEHYVTLLSNEQERVNDFYRIIGNTSLLGLVVPTLSMFIGLLVAYSKQTVKIPFTGVLSFVAATTLAVPAITKGLGFLVLFVPTQLYGTFWLLLLAFLSFTIPIAMRYSSPALTRLGQANFEASISIGDNVFGAFRRITLPLIKGDFISGWMHVYVSTIRNVPIAILLYSAGSEVMAVELLFLLTGGYFRSAATMAVILSVMAVIPYMLLQYYRIHIRKKRAAVAP